MTASHTLTFAAIATVIIAVPGPSVLFTISRALTVGRTCALFTVAGLVALFLRRREPAPRQAAAGALAGLAFACFWLTREESIWLVPAVGLLLLAPALALRRELAQRWRGLAAGVGGFVVLAVLPLLFVSTMNLRHYGWFGTVEFRAPEFKAAYGALTRPIVGPDLKQVPVTRQMREVAYELSPAFAKLLAQRARNPRCRRRDHNCVEWRVGRQPSGSIAMKDMHIHVAQIMEAALGVLGQRNVGAKRDDRGSERGQGADRRQKSALSKSASHAYLRRPHLVNRLRAFSDPRTPGPSLVGERG